MKKFFFQLFILFSILSKAQVGINTSMPNATLDVRAHDDTTKSDGIIPPRLTAEQLKSKDNAYQTNQTGSLVYITQRLTSEPSTKTIKVKDPGYYYFDGEIWQAIESTTQTQDWFYMPSFNIDMSSLGQKTVDLYANYSGQFTKKTTHFFSSDTNTSIISNLKAPLFNADELEYIVTFYDEQYITINNISSLGLMTYTVNDTNPPSNTFINIVLKPLK